MPILLLLLLLLLPLLLLLLPLLMLLLLLLLMLPLLLLLLLPLLSPAQHCLHSNACTGIAVQALACALVLAICQLLPPLLLLPCYRRSW